MNQILTVISTLVLIVWNLMVRITHLTERIVQWKRSRRNPRESTQSGNKVQNLVESDIVYHYKNLQQEVDRLYNNHERKESETTDTSKSSPPSLDSSQRSSPDQSPERQEHEESLTVTATTTTSAAKKKKTE